MVNALFVLYGCLATSNRKNCDIFYSNRLFYDKTLLKAGNQLDFIYKMFQVKENECVGFESRWKVKKVYFDNTSQTSEIDKNDKEMNTVSRNEIETQTENEAPTEHTSREVDQKSLGDFLTKVYPLMKLNMDDANNSQAFKNFVLNDHDKEVKLLQKLTVRNKDVENVENLRVGVLSWNCTGQSLAVSCNFTHKSWCLHRGFVNIYTFDSNSMLPETPRNTFNTDACVTALTYHPSLPSVLAAGTFSGNIYVWNITRGDNDNAIANINGHEETVTQIAWINNIDLNKSVILTSSSLDGFLNLWSFNPTTGLKLKEKYKFKPPMLARIGNRKLVTEEMSKKPTRGVICYDFSSHVNDMFLVGLEGGLLVQCSMLGTTKLKESKDEVPISNAVFKYYEPLEGEVISISFSRNKKDLFLTYSADSKIRIFMIGMEEPVKIIFTKEALNVVTFVPNEEKLIVGCGVKGVLQVYDILTKKIYKDVITDTQNVCVLTDMAINIKRPSTVAVGNENGEIHLVQIPWRALSSGN